MFVSGVMVTSWAAWIVAVLVVGVAVTVFLMLLSGRRSPSPAGAVAVCGQCGYNVRGLSTFICPECGGDLREVGIVKGGRTGGKKWIHLLWIIPVWAAGCMFVGLLLYQLIEAMAADPQPGVVHRQVGGKIAVPLMMLIGLGGLVWIIYRTANALPLWPRRWSGAASAALPAAASRPSNASSSPSAPSTQPATTRTAVLTIMFIDMAGFTERAAASSRDGLIELIRKVRELVQPVLARRRGRIVKTVGDGFLITFDSPTEAVLAGRDVQRTIARRNALHDDEEPVTLRIGVTTGEVALEDNDVYGEPVNLASRIQQLAEPGEVYFSEATWHAMTRSEVAHEEVGERALKGIDGAVRVFRVRMDGAPA